MNRTTLAALAALAAASSPAAADDRVAAAEDDPANASPPAIDERATSSRELTDDIDYRLIGYLRLEAAMVADDPDVDFVGRNDGFRLQNARVGVEGTWRDRLTVRLSADGALDERENANEVEGTLRFALKDAYADIELASAATVRVARFKPYFDIEELTSPSRRTFIDSALSSRGVFATEGFETRGLGVGRSLGVALRSDAVLERPSFALGYELAVQNGNSELDAANDNDSLAYSAAGFATIAEVASVFAAGRYNSRTEGELPFRRTEDDIEVAAGARIASSSFRATAQAIFRRTQFPTTGGPDENAFGAHAEALIKIPSLEWLELGYRYSFLEPSDLIPSDRVQEHTAGINVAVSSWRSTVQINATHAVEQSGRKLSNDRVEALFQVSL